MAQYGAASPRIDDIRLSPSNASPGDNVEVEVDITDTASVPRGESDEFNIAFVFVESPVLDQHILIWCGLIRPGQTVTVDDSSGSDEGWDGEFPLQTQTADVKVHAGGHIVGTTCSTANYPESGTDNVSATVVAGTPDSGNGGNGDNGTGGNGGGNGDGGGDGGTGDGGDGGGVGAGAGLALLALAAIAVGSRGSG